TRWLCSSLSGELQILYLGQKDSACNVLAHSSVYLGFLWPDLVVLGSSSCSLCCRASPTPSMLPGPLRPLSAARFGDSGE
ncbi:Os08g0209900, partial [Oryza sativa Japonica Group]